MSRNERRSDWLVVLGIGLVLWGGWWLLNGFLAPLLWPLRAVLDAVSRVGWPLALIAIGVLVIVAARRGGQVVIRGRRLYRSRENRMVGGVLAGAADYFGVDPTLLRVVYAVLAVFTSFFPAFVLYIIAMVVIPEEPVTTVIDGHVTRGRPRAGTSDPADRRAAPPIAPPPPVPPTPAPTGAPRTAAAAQSARAVRVARRGAVACPKIAEAKPTKPGDVIDAHVHLFTLPLLEEMRSSGPRPAKRFKQALKEGKWGRRRRETLPDLTAEEMRALVRRAASRRPTSPRRSSSRCCRTRSTRATSFAPPTATCTRCATSIRATRARPSCSSARWLRASAA